jgi:cyclase
MQDSRSRPAILSRPGAIALLGAALTVGAAGQSQDYTHFRWHEAASGMWLGVTPPNSFISGNTVIIALPDGGSMVVDPHITEFTANEIIAKARQVGDPVRYLVNTHLHNDHTQGNTAFKKAFPAIDIIAHRNTCQGTKEKAIPRSAYRLEKLGREVEEIRKNRAGVRDAAMATALDRIITGNQRYLADARTLAWTLPTTCLDLEPGGKRIYGSGDRIVEVAYFGRAHTAGDLVVYLPHERIIINGDLWFAAGGLGGDGRDGSMLDAPATLRAIRALDFDVVLPGHGDLFTGKHALDTTIANAEALVARVKASHASGDYLERTLEVVTPPARAGASVQGGVSQHVPYMRTPADAGWRRAVTRAYEEIELRKQLGLPLN